MPNFESPISNKSFSAGNFKELDVPDESMQPLHQHQHQHQHQQSFQQANESIQNFQQKLQQSFPNENSNIKNTSQDTFNDGAKRRIEMLLGMTQSTRDCVIENNNYSLKSLKSKEMRAALMAASEFDGTIQAPYEIRRQFLARSLTHVAGIEIDHFLGTKTLESKLLFLDELDESLLNRLYEEYLILNKDSREKFAINTAQDAKEVVEDIKKS